LGRRKTGSEKGVQKYGCRRVIGSGSDAFRQESRLYQVYSPHPTGKCSLFFEGWMEESRTGYRLFWEAPSAHGSGFGKNIKFKFQSSKFKKMIKFKFQNLSPFDF
jgi:hypothetical protein